jgi:hypothetical protein
MRCSGIPGLPGKAGKTDLLPLAGQGGIAPKALHSAAATGTRLHLIIGHTAWHSRVSRRMASCTEAILPPGEMEDLWALRSMTETRAERTGAGMLPPGGSFGTRLVRCLPPTLGRPGCPSPGLDALR